ncbi:AI-2E family transporter [Myxococcaceae bacterium GXIMD 01537]
MTSETTARRVFTGLIILSLVLLALLIQPFAKAFFLAAVLAGSLYGLHVRFTRRLRGRANLSAGLLSLAVVIALLLPLSGLTAFVVTEVVDGVKYVNQTVRREGLEGLMEKLPGPLRRLSQSAMDRFSVQQQQLAQTLEEQLQQHVSASGGSAAKAVTGAVASTGNIILQAVMMLIAFFFLLVDGAALVRWVESISPLKHGQASEILREFRNVSVSVLASTLATAGVQAAAALVGYLIAGVPVPLFFAAITFLLALIPAVGAAVVCLAAALLMLLNGETKWAIFLAIWGVTVVGLVDNIVKPLLVKRGLQLHGGIVFFSLLGGLAAFGTVGLLLGPLIVSFFLALVRIYERDYGRTPANAPGLLTPPTNLPPTPPTAPPLA